MDSNNESPPPPPPPPPPQGGNPSMEAGDWRNQLQSDSRQRIVNKIMDTLKRHLPFSSQVGLHELEKVAVRFEEKIYTAATSQSDYLRKISLKMLTMETKSQNTMANSLQTNPASNSNRPPDPGFMDSNNGSPPPPPPPPPQGGDPSMEAGNWRSKLASDMRQQLIKKIMATLNGHPPFSGQEGLDELKKTAARFEEEFYAAATSQSDYVQKISQKMLTFVNKPQKTMVNSLESNGAGNSNGLLNPGSSGMQPQVANQGQSVSMPLPANQSQTRQQFVPRNIQNNILPSGVQSSAGLSSALSPTVHYHLYYLQPPASGQNMSGLSSPQGLNMSGLSSALPLASTMSRLSSAPPPAIFPTGALTAQQNMMNPSQPISSMFPGQGNAPKNLLQQVSVGSIQQTPVSTPQQAYMNALSQNGINMLQRNINPLQSNSGALTAQQNMMNPSQPISSMVPGQGNAPKNLLQQVHVGSIQQTPVSAPVSAPFQAYMNALSSQNGINMLQGSINPLQSNSGILHNQHLKQQQQQVYQNQLKQQYQQQQMQQQLMQKQQIIQLQQQQLVLVQRQQQWPGQSLTHQMPQLRQISVVNDVSKNASSSPSGSTMLQASIDSLKSNSGIVDNQHLRQEQEQKMFQNQLKLPYQQLQMQKPQILQDKQQQQIKQLQQQAKQQLHHIYFIYLIFLTILLGAAFFGIGY